MTSTRLEGVDIAPRTSTADWPATAEWANRHFRALVLLGGGVRPTPFTTAIRRPLLDLPAEDGATILDCWTALADQLAVQLKVDQLPVRVMISQDASLPTVRRQRDHLDLHVEHDANSLRGTAGVLRDLAEQYADDDYILVANAAQLMFSPLGELLAGLHGTGGDVSVVSHADGTPSGVMLIRCGVLDCVPAVGFMDMKEQALPRIADHHRVAVCTWTVPTGLPIRTPSGYISALRWHHRRLSGRPDLSSPFEESWQPTFSLVEPAARVAPDVRVHDSVVLDGAQIDSGAVLVNTIACMGGGLGRGKMAVDQVIASPTRGKGG
jgi:hypothetical protein